MADDVVQKQSSQESGSALVTKGKTRDAFMVHFKKLKQRNPPADLSKVINFQNFDHKFIENDKVKRIHCHKDALALNIWGVKTPNEMDIFEFKRLPGVIFVKNPFTAQSQRYWIVRCLQDYPDKPNVCNLDNVAPGRDDKNIWRTGQTDQRGKSALHSMRWVTLGYHYDWTRKIYRRNHHTTFPEDLYKLSEYMSAVVGYPRYRSEAAIINFYHMDSCLAGHTDHSEFDLHAPLLSTSFGQTCVFMVGGGDKSIEPEALFLHSGDLVIMKDSARLNYHAVPKILMRNPGTTVERTYMEPFTEQCEDNSPSTKRLRLTDDFLSYSVMDIISDELLWKPFSEYLKTSRLNMNVRQVFKPGQTANDCHWSADDRNDK